MRADPSAWEFGGYAEMQAAWGEGSIASITDYGALMELTGTDSMDALREDRKGWVDAALARGELARESRWTESVAAGSKGFLETVKAKLGLRAKGPKVSGSEDESILREPQMTLGGDFDE